MKNLIKISVMAIATAGLMAGCSGGLPTLPGVPAAGASTAPTTTATTAPTTATTTTAHTGTSGTSASCTRTAPDLNDTTKVDVGASDEGRYSGQHLTLGYGSLGSEAAVTAAIDGLDQADYDCFSLFYPGATSVYTSIKAGS